MEHLYGHRWTGHYGRALNEASELTLAARQWAHDLAPFTSTQIGAALKATELEHPDWPPTVPQFKAMCRRFPAVGGAPDPETILLAQAQEALQQARSDARLGVLAKTAPTYLKPARAALEAAGDLQGPEAATRFVRAYLAASETP